MKTYRRLNNVVARHVVETGHDIDWEGGELSWKMRKFPHREGNGPNHITLITAEILVNVNY